ncbi:hypothetical protein V8C86DRAFT_3152692, partial [Haematococcus lacustris]
MAIPDPAGGGGGHPAAYPAWLCRLVAALLTHCSDPVLRLMHSLLAVNKPAVAELLLPEVLLHLLLFSADSEPLLLRQITEQLSQHILQPASHLAQGTAVLSEYSAAWHLRTTMAGPADKSVTGVMPGRASGSHSSTAAARLWLNALEQLRALHVADIVQWNAGKPARGSSPAVPGVPVGQEPRNWRTSCGLELDLLLLARTAVSCGSPLTGLTYLEEWMERHAGGVHGGLPRMQAAAHAHHAATSTDLTMLALAPMAPTLPSAAAAAAAGPPSTGSGRGGGRGGRQQALQPVEVPPLPAAEAEDLLRNIWQSIDEPDCLYALAARAQAQPSEIMLGKGWEGGQVGAEGVGQGQGQGEAGLTPVVARARVLGSGAHARAGAAAGEVGGAGGVEGGSGWGPAAPPADMPGGSVMGQAAAGLLATGGVGGSGALAALQAGEQHRFKAALNQALAGSVSGLRGAATESLAAVSTPLSWLRLVRVLEEGWGRRWESAPSQPKAPALYLLPPSGAVLHHPPPTGPGLGWGAEDGGGASGEGARGLELLTALRCQVLAAVGDAGQLAAALTHSASQHRRSGALAAGLADIARLRAHINACRPPVHSKTAATPPHADPHSLPAWVRQQLRPDSEWRLEEARLMWRDGRRQAAARAMHTLATAMWQSNAQPAGQGAADGPRPDPLQLATALSCAGHWAAAAQMGELGPVVGSDAGQAAGGSGTGSGAAGQGVLGLLSQAAQLVTEHVILKQGSQDHAPGDPALSRAREESACKVVWRLARYADGLYSELVAQRGSEEYREKRRQMADMQSRIPKAKTELERRTLQYLLGKLSRPVAEDEAAREAATNAELSYRTIAITNYKRCLQAGRRYDLPVVYRLCALWLALCGEADANRQFRAAFKELPSHKFVPLVYQ